MSQKDQELLQDLIQKYAKLFMKLAYNNGVPYDDVEDVVMDAFWSFYRSKYYDSMDESEIKIMMGRIVKNKCIDYYRKNRKDEEMVADDGEEGLVGIAAHPMTNPERRMIEKEKYRRICDEIEKSGKETMLYTNPHHAGVGLDLEALDGMNVWIALYSEEMSYPYYITAWQYTCTGKVDGIEGDVDINLFFGRNEKA